MGRRMLRTTRKGIKILISPFVACGIVVYAHPKFTKVIVLICINNPTKKGELATHL
jgi:hypothetical protein